MTEREALVALNMVQGIGAVTIRAFKECFGSFAEAFSVSATALERVSGIGRMKSADIFPKLHSVDWKSELAKAERNGVSIATWLDAEYPAELKEIADPPPVLYARGNWEALSMPCVAMVGTRRATVYGRETARRIAFQLAGMGYCVVSGLAAGIDTESHQGALRAKGKTAGVLGGALNCFYPKENEPLAKEIVSSGGIIVSEFPFGRQPDKTTFPMRNRVVSGLCRGVVAVETPRTGGTMITMQTALDQNRCVMAVPGRVDSPSSQGCHELIRQGARLVADANDIAEELGQLFPTNFRAEKKEAPSPKPVLSPDEEAVWAQLTTEGVHADQLARLTGLAPGRLTAVLTALQLKRLAKTLPGGLHAKK